MTNSVIASPYAPQIVLAEAKVLVVAAPSLVPTIQALAAQLSVVAPATPFVVTAST